MQKLQFFLWGALIAFLFAFASFQSIYCQKKEPIDNIKKSYKDISKEYNLPPFHFIIGRDSMITASINKDVLFQEESFENPFSLSDIIFNSIFHIYSCTFNDNFDVYGSVFKNEFVLESDTFSYGGNFNSCVFDSLTFLRHFIFNGKSSFIQSIFNGRSIFTESDFKNSVSFYGATFNSSASFEFTKFDSLANFGDCKFNFGPNFYGIRLPQYLDLSFVQIMNGEIDLSTSNPQKNGYKCWINLTGTDINKIKLQYKFFKLWFPDEPYRLSFDQKSNIYESLLKRFENLGYKESYKELDIEYKKFKEFENGNWLLKTFFRLKQIWNNFGYNKEYIFYWIIFLVVLFSIINSLFLKKLNTNIYTVFRDNETLWLRKFSVGAKIKYSFYYTMFVFFGFKLDFKEIKSYGWGLFYILIIYILGLICVAYFANFVLSK